MPHLTLPVPPQTEKIPQWRSPVFWVQSLVGTLLGGGLMYLSISALRSLNGWETAVLCAALPVMIWVQILIHELGHAIAGFFSGHRMLAFGIGPVRVSRQGQNWVFQWESSRDAIAGFVLMLPQQDSAGRWRPTIYLLGGPFANLLFAAFCFQWNVYDFYTDADLVNVLLRIATGIALLIGIVNLIPFMAGGWYSDGRYLLKLWQKSGETHVLMFLRQLSALSVAGVRARDWPVPSFSFLHPQHQLPQSVVNSLAVCYLYKAIDERKPHQPEVCDAAIILAKNFWLGTPSSRPVTALILSRWLNEVEGDIEDSQAWANLAEGGLVDQSAELALLKTQIALRRGDENLAQRYLQEATTLRHRVQPGASLVMFNDDLQSIHARLSDLPP
ncbi:M50 family metallopeptidase [Limnohabitans sp. MMS-10A-178]|uniref:M50 family metallopeptidase n=1 Tax=Limnohabitans sp. MMS-10A-178 TaxID=1835767 RepID=UPI0011B1DCCB|nr:M50 family metallopeptidase [Limnohabitans sp. MMS-10A-178]